MRDDCFIRGSVPMTKEEVRAIVISKLDLNRDSILWDIGAGTGSVSIEASVKTPVSEIFAFEKNPEGIELIQKNKEKFSCKNITVIQGVFPDQTELCNLPKPSHVFIGGSDGRIPQILDLIREISCDAKIVLTCISLESIAAITDYMKANELKAEITFVSISKSKELGKYHLLQGSNPIAVFSLGGQD